MLKYVSKGSYTIEATIVLSSVLIALCAVMFAFMVMYQNVVIIYSASYGAQQGARAWSNTGISMDGKTRGYNSELYSGIAEMWGDGKTSEKKARITECVNNKLKMSIFSTKSATVDVDFKNYILQRKVVVEINQQIPIPFSGIVKFFNSGNPFELHAKMEAAVVEPTEYIRNVDYALDWVLSSKSWFEKTLGKDQGDAVINAIKGLR